MKKAASLLCALMMLFSGAVALAENAELTATPEPNLTSAGVDRNQYVWGADLDDSWTVSDTQGKERWRPLLDLFEDCVYENKLTEAGDINYYVYDPVAHGYPADGDYPIYMSLHGANMQLQGKESVMLQGATLFVNEEIQNKIGPMYIVVPFVTENVPSWKAEEYIEPLMDIFHSVIEKYNVTGEHILYGYSAGGRMARNVMDKYADEFDMLVLVGTWAPTVEQAQTWSDMGIHIMHLNSYHDEAQALVPTLEKKIKSSFTEPVIKYQWIKNYDFKLVEWVFNCDGSVVSNQHLICCQLNRDFIGDDGIPDYKELPDGFSGWFEKTLEAVRAEKTK